MPGARTLSCQHPNWEDDLLYLISSDYEVDLADFEYEKHGAFCEDIAKRFMVKLSVDRDPRQNALHFRKLEASLMLTREPKASGQGV